MESRSLSSDSGLTWSNLNVRLWSTLSKQRGLANFWSDPSVRAIHPAIRYQSQRFLASSSHYPPNGFQVSTVFTLLTTFGVVVTAYGLYDFYSSFSPWPQAIRSDLRTAIKAQNQGNLNLSEQYLHRAWEKCLQIPREDLNPDPWLKISGIACKLGEVLESAHKLEQAYNVYLQCAKAMRTQADKNSLSMAERSRAVALALHVGNLAGQLQKSHDEEQWLLWSVEQLMPIHETSTSSSSHQFASGHSHAQDLVGLPSWVADGELESAIEALASYYAKQGQTEYALGLYLRAISHLLPPNSSEAREKASPRKRCRAAQLMTRVSNLLVQDAPSPERLNQAKEWTTKGLEIVEKARQIDTTEPECERTLAVSLYNLGALLEMQGQKSKAGEQFRRALGQSRTIKFADGIENAEDALIRLSLQNNHEVKDQYKY